MSRPCPALTLADAWTDIDRRGVPRWFDEAKFGIFIHWGVFSVPAWAPVDVPTIPIPFIDASYPAPFSEWYWLSLSIERALNALPGHFVGPTLAHHNTTYGASFEYPQFAPMWDASRFNPASWASLIHDSGAHYVVQTSKHHDGFCLWPSAQAENWPNAFDPSTPLAWNSVIAGPGRDIVGELTAAIRATETLDGSGKIRMGLYYSLLEWFNADYYQKSDEELAPYVENHLRPQFEDLVKRYEPSLIWTDGEWDHSVDAWQSTTLLDWLFGSPDLPEAYKREVVVGDRWGKLTRSVHGGYHTLEQFERDFFNPGCQLDNARKWELAQTFHLSWGYNTEDPPSEFASSLNLIQLLVQIVAKGANLLLNIGPKSDGTVPPEQEERLRDIGAWLKVNGEAIFRTRPWRVQSEGAHVETYWYVLSKGTMSGREVWYTQGESAVYAILLGTRSGEVTLTAPIPSDATSITLLQTSQRLEWTVRDGGLVVALPSDVQPSAALVLRLTAVH
jgi:alpha-L-fucosidase